MLRNSVVRNHMEEEAEFNLWRPVSDAQRTAEKLVGRGGLTLLPLSYAEQLRVLLKRGSNQINWFIRFHTSINQQGKQNRSRPRKKNHWTGHRILSQHRNPEYALSVLFANGKLCVQKSRSLFLFLSMGCPAFMLEKINWEKKNPKTNNKPSQFGMGCFGVCDGLWLP